MIEVEYLNKSYGPLRAVRDVSLSVRQGDVLGFLGPNGAGKSTTMRMITGYLSPDSGQITVCGCDPLKARNQIGYLPEGAPGYDDMTARSFLAFCGKTRGMNGRDLKAAIDRTSEICDLAGVMDKSLDTLSKGFRRRVGLAQAILHDPQVLILDEPTDGLDPNQKQAVRTLIRTMSEGKAILLSTHILEEVEAVCTRTVIIANGQIRADDTPKGLIARDPRHGLIVVTIPRHLALQAKAAFEAVAGIAGIKLSQGKNADITLELTPAKGAHPATAIATLVKKNNWPVTAFGIEKGRLDAVFRALTMNNTENEATA